MTRVLFLAYHFPPIGGIWYVPKEDPNYDQTGIASWYGDAFHMKATANGETFDMNAVSAAHTTLPLPSALQDEGASRDVFNQREVGHMNDVRDIVRLVGRIGNLCMGKAG